MRMTENRRAESVRCVGKKKNGRSGRSPFTKAGMVLVNSEQEEKRFLSIRTPSTSPRATQGNAGGGKGPLPSMRR